MLRLTFPKLAVAALMIVTLGGTPAAACDQCACGCGRYGGYGYDYYYSGYSYGGAYYAPGYGGAYYAPPAYYYPPPPAYYALPPYAYYPAPRYSPYYAPPSVGYVYRPYYVRRW